MHLALPESQRANRLLSYSACPLLLKLSFFVAQPHTALGLVSPREHKFSIGMSFFGRFLEKKNSNKKSTGSYYFGSGYHDSVKVNASVRDGGFGFVITGGLENDDMLPTVQLDNTVDFKGELCSGDVLLTVNGAKVVGRKANDVAAMLASCAFGSPTKFCTLEILSHKEHRDGKNKNTSHALK